jgi:hypothetical protein
MTRMVSYLQGGTVSLASPGFKVMLSALLQLALRLVALPVTEDEMLVLDLLSNSAFMGTDGEGLPLLLSQVRIVPATFQAHILLPCSGCEKIFDNCNQIGQLAASAQNVFRIVPILKQVTKKLW